MASDSPDFFKFFHLLWIAAGGVLTVIWKRLDGKADKEDLDAKHAENIKRLDAILEKQDSFQETLTLVREDVARLKERTGVNGYRRR